MPVAPVRHVPAGIRLNERDEMHLLRSYFSTLVG
jgi:hypothetical protein